MWKSFTKVLKKFLVSNMKNFISTHNCTFEELGKILKLATQLKSKPIDDCLKNKSVALVFFNPSLRTRTSFEVGINQLGGHSTTLDVGGQIWNLEYKDGAVMDGQNVEHIKDASKVLSKYFDFVCVRSFPQMKDWNEDKKDPIIKSFKKYLDIPLISMESALYHPCQALADIMTIKEKLNKPEKKKFVLSWSYHPKSLPTAVPNSASIIASQFGMDVTIVNPKDFELPKETMNIVEKNCKDNGSSFEVVNSHEGFENADIIYAKSWGSLKYYGQPEIEGSIKKDLKGWIVDKEKMGLTKNAKFMHCLPVRRNVEVADEVLDSKNSIVYDQAENRLHAQKGLLKYLMGDKK